MRTRKEFMEELTKNCDEENGFYDGRKAKSYNPYILMSVGARSIGKTFWYKTLYVYDFLADKEQFIYTRRTQTELDEIDKDSFITEKSFEMMFYEYKLIEKNTTNHGTRIRFNGDGKEYTVNFSSRNMLINGEICCYMKALSTWGKLKGSEYDKVKKILYDEVLIDIARNTYYLPNEIEALVQLIKSVERDRKIEVVLLSNATNYNNIYFNHFNFYGDNSKRFWYIPNKVNKKARGILIEFPKNKKITPENDPDFYNFSMGTKVFDSNTDNNFQLQYADKNVGKIKGKKVRLYSIYSDGTFITVYNANGLMYVAKGYDKNLHSYTFNLSEVENGHIYIDRSSTISKHIRRNFHNGLINYEDMGTKIIFNNMIRGIL